MTLRIGFCLRRTATKFAPACIAQLFQVELQRGHSPKMMHFWGPLRRQQSLVQILGASLAYSRFLKSSGYKKNDLKNIRHSLFWEREPLYVEGYTPSGRGTKHWIGSTSTMDEI